jgi:hypothetical protein
MSEEEMHMMADAAHQEWLDLIAERDSLRAEVDRLMSDRRNSPASFTVPRYEELIADNRRLREALVATLSWLTSYPGGLANKCYDQARAALAQRKGAPGA